MHPPRRILAVRLASLGDVLIVTPALRALRASFPDAHIGTLITPGSAVALSGNDSVDEILLFDKFAFDRPRDALSNTADALSLAAKLRTGRWDTLVLLHHLTTPFGIAKYAALALGSGAEQRVGLDNGRGGWFLTHSAKDFGFGVKHEVDYYLDVVRVLGAEYPGAPRLQLPIASDDDAWAAARWRELTADDVEAVLIVPGSGAFSRARRWAPERFVAVADDLWRRDGLTPLILSGVDPDEQALARRIADQLGSVARLVPAAPRPQALAAFIRRCRLVVGNDGGVIHLATTVGTPVVAVFGPSNDRAWGPYPAEDARHRVVREALACAPCIHRGHSFGTPQGCPARTCLAIVEVPAVLEAARSVLRAGTAEAVLA
jgi:ADP-heptose:LPS heptosyltransferase